MKNNIAHFFLWRLGLAAPWTFYGSEECESLGRYAKDKKNLVEIGCWQGVNTCRLRRAMAEDAAILCVDPYTPGRLGFNAARIIAHEEVAKIRRGTLTWLRMTDLDAARSPVASGRAPFDFIFSDSANDYDGFAAAWNAWSPLLTRGGIYVLANSSAPAGHRFEHAGSVRFTKEVILKSPGFTLRETAGCFTILEKQ